VWQVLRGLEAATICMEDMDEWLAIFNVKLRHMREDIESVRLFLYMLLLKGDFIISKISLIESKDKSSINGIGLVVLDCT
jgi:exocyst complex component 1